MWTINDLIKSGMEFFTGKTVLKSTLEAKETELAEANKKIEATEKERDTARTELATARTELATANTELGTVKPQLVTAKTKIAELEKAAKTVSQTATEIAAAQGIPAAQLPATGASAALTDAQLLEQFNAIKDPKERGEFYAKHFAPKFNNKS